jgi:hypothetical protein
VRRIKAVLLDWLPRRLDPLAFYYWKRPLHNILALWVLSHACLYPGHWLLSMALLVTAVLLWHIVIQVCGPQDAASVGCVCKLAILVHTALQLQQCSAAVL